MLLLLFLYPPSGLSVATCHYLERVSFLVSQEGGTWEEAVSFVTSSFSTLQGEEHLVNEIPYLPSVLPLARPKRETSLEIMARGRTEERNCEWDHDAFLLLARSRT